MNKTRFAGLTRLDPSDPISTDNASFQSRNPEIEDRLLEIGAVTHRHDNHAALPSPSQLSSPSGNIVASGGNIPSDFALSFGYTLNDSDGGETTLSGVGLAATAPGYDPPADPITGSADYNGGGLVTATYHYGITMLDGEGGETALGPVVDVERQPGHASGEITLAGLSTDLNINGATAWALYRAMGGGDWVYLASGTADTFLDNGIQCVDCSRRPPDDLNQTTNQANTLLITVPTDDPAWSRSTSFNLYLTIDGDFSDAMFIGNFPLASGGIPIPITQLDFAAIAPPDVSTCIPGAHQIDPDSELLDWHWKRPVSTKTALPTGTLGDVRLVTDKGQLWGVLHASAATWTDWSQLVGGGSGGSAGITRVFDDRGDEAIDPSELEFVAGSGTTAKVYASGDTAIVQINTPFYVEGGSGTLAWNDSFTGTITDLPLNYEADGYKAPDFTNYSYGDGGLRRDDTLGTSRLVAGASATGFLATDTRGRVKVKKLAGGTNNYHVNVGINRVGPAVGDQSANDYLIAYFEGSVIAGTPSLLIYDSPGPNPPTAGNLIASVGGLPQLVAGQTAWLELERIGHKVTARWFTSDPDLGAAPTAEISANLSDARTAHLDATPAPGFFGSFEDVADNLIVQNVRFWALKKKAVRVNVHGRDRLVMNEDGGTDFLPAVAGSGGVGRLLARSEIQVAGSGGTQVGIENLGGGSARIVISGSGSVGPQGPAGASGATGAQGPPGSPGTGGGVAASMTVAGSAGVPEFFGKSYLEFAGSGGIGASIQDLGGGSARVLFGGGPLASGMRSVNAGTSTFTNTGAAAVVSPADSVSFTMQQAGLVQIFAMLNLWNNGASQSQVGIWIDGVELSQELGGDFRGKVDNSNGNPQAVWTGPSVLDGNPVASGATAFQTSQAGVTDFSRHQVSTTDPHSVGRPVSLWLGAGQHTIELRFRVAAGTGSTSQRTLIVVPPPGAAVGTGPGGGGGHVIENASGGVYTPLPQETNLALGSGLTGSDDPAHSATQVKVTLVRNQVIVNTGTLASGWQASGVVGGSANVDVALGNLRGELIYRVASDRPMRVRAYAGSGQRAADASRAIGADPTGDHGVLLDFVTVPSDLDWTLSPMVVYAITDGQPIMPLRIDNLGALGSVQTTLTVLPLEF